MWWVAGVAVLSALGMLEWRSWKKPSRSALDEAHISSYNHARTLSGGTDI